jgi:FkbM family methyltransferase
MSKIENILLTLRVRGLRRTMAAMANGITGAVRRSLGQRFIVRPVYGYRMLLDLDDPGISRTLLLFGERELEHKVMLERVLKSGMTVLDIGANIGYYALMELGLIGPSGRLIAIEPSPSNFDLLKRNLALNGYKDVEVHQLAASDRSDTRPFFISTMSNLNTFHDTGTGSLHLKGEAIQVRTAAVPEIMAGRKLDLIRMDVEGHEVEVLAGLLPAIERGEMAPMIIFETHLSRYKHGHDMEAILKRLFASGYRISQAASSSARGTRLVEGRGYKGSPPIVTDEVERVIFEDVRADDAIHIICSTGGLRTVLLAPP